MKNFLSLLFLICISFSACSLSGGNIKPAVSIVDVQFSDLSLFEIGADFTVRVQNENPVELSFEGATHNIYLNGVNIGKGLVNESFNVPRLGTATHKVKIHVSNLSLIRNMQDFINAREYDYRIDSVLYRSGGFGIRRYNISESGRFNRF